MESLLPRTPIEIAPGAVHAHDWLDLERSGSEPQNWYVGAQNDVSDAKEKDADLQHRHGMASPGLESHLGDTLRLSCLQISAFRFSEIT